MTEQEARGLAFESLGAHDQRLASGLAPNLAHFNAALNAYRAAVRAETLREARAEVEKVRQQITARAAIEFPRPSAATKDAINALVSLTDGILTALDALAQPEGME
jgi:hypothetical protein